VELLTVSGTTAPYIPPDALTIPTYLYSYGVSGAGFLLLIVFALRSRAVHRRHTLFLLGAAVAGLVTATASQVGLVSHPGIDVAPLGFVVVGAAMGWALLRYDFLRHTPLAEDVVVDELPDPVFGVDDERVIDFNPAAAEAFSYDDPTSEPLDEVVSAWPPTSTTASLLSPLRRRRR